MFENEMVEGSVLVGIDGSPAGDAALRWAAAEAGRRAAHLVIVHAGHVEHAEEITPTTAATLLHERCGFGQELLAEAVATLVEDYPTLEVSTVLTENDPGLDLVAMSARAAVTVVGRGRTSAIRRAVFGSVARHVADRASSPVAVIPDSSEAAAIGGPVAVGVSETEGGTAAMEFACAEAELQHTNLLAIRSGAVFPWSLVSLGAPASVRFEDILASERGILERCVRTAQAAHPNLKIEQELTFTPMDEYFVDLTGSSLLVLGCRRHDTQLFSRLGPHVGWILEHIAIPVAIVNQTAAQSGD